MIQMLGCKQVSIMTTIYTWYLFLYSAIFLSSDETWHYVLYFGLDAMKNDVSLVLVILFPKQYLPMAQKRRI